MWTLRVAVSVGGIGVDANLRILQFVVPVSLKLLTSSKEWLDDCRTCGVAELREETSRRGAIPVGARGGLGVNREIAGGVSGLRPENLASTSFVAKLLSQDVNGQSADEISEMADRRYWGGGGDDPEESTQRMIERIWESLTDIRARMDQQAPIPPVVVPPGDGEAVPVAPVPPRVEVPFVAPVPPPPPVQLAEEPVMQVERFLRLQPPTYSGGPNPDIAEHWAHEIERVFATMRCSAADRVVKSRVGPEMKQDLLLFSWSWRPGVAVDWLASRLVDIDFLNLAAVDVDAKGGGIRRTITIGNCIRDDPEVDDFFRSSVSCRGRGWRPDDFLRSTQPRSRVEFFREGEYIDVCEEF
ncbi:hypothetical protein Taro_008324 [Colocasia esculenta]|uniref:Uncharacterized protein n=1 Tax=Colocasia esculenta TaxID=4460 RepID=A0A843TWT9_COLES|nr:hypothetical protein [Colocasia esculenta]